MLVLVCFQGFSKIPEMNAIIKEKALKIHVNYSNEIIVLQKGIIKKYDATGNLMVTYGNIYINADTKIISFNTFRTVLYCEDYGKVIILDKRFGEIAMIDVFSFPDIVVSDVGISYDNSNLWFYDAVRQVLVKVSQQGKVIYTSSNINFYTNTSIQPNYISEIATNLYINDSSKGIFIFDNTGTFKKLIPIPHITSFYVMDNQFFYIENEIIYSYNQLSFEKTSYANVPKLNQIQLGLGLLCGINENGFVEIWNY